MNSKCETPVRESIPKRQPLKISHIVSRCILVLKHRKFIAGVIISGLVQIQIMLYPTLGPFIVENLLNKSSLVYGNTALLVGACYLIGSLINRFLLKHTTPKIACYVGHAILAISLLISYFFAMFLQLSLPTIMLPMGLMCISAGFVFSNIMSANLKEFPEHAGISMAIQMALLLLIATLGIMVISYIHVTILIQLTFIFSVLILLQIIIFFVEYKSIF